MANFVFTPHASKSKIITKVIEMNRDGNRILPYSRREHFFMLYKVNGETVGIPHTFDQ